jgi:hypothetical protein
MAIEDRPRQKLFRTIGETGCFLLSIIHLAEHITGKYIDAFATYLLALGRGQIGEDCFVKDAGSILSDLTGNVYNMSKEAAGYQCKPGELEILRYEWQEVSTLHGHFVAGNGWGAVEYDPYGTSLTVANGKMVSKRIFRRI